jgi:peptide/nickel transport system permease protein
MKGPLRDITLIEDSDFVRNFLKGIRLMLTERTTRIYFMFILFVLCLGLFGPYINPYDYDERVRDDDGHVLTFLRPGRE